MTHSKLHQQLLQVDEAFTQLGLKPATVILKERHPEASLNEVQQLLTNYSYNTRTIMDDIHFELKHCTVVVEKAFSTAPANFIHDKYD